MLLNYLKVAMRSLLRKKGFTIINISGLAVGATASLLIFLFVQRELSYDQYFPEGESIYRVVEDRIYPDRIAHFAAIPDGFSTILPDEIPEVEMSTRLIGFPNFTNVVRYGDNVYNENYFFAADSNFFELFPFQLLRGSPAEVLRDHHTIVLTASTATRYFGTDDPMGKVLKVNGEDATVVGVMQDVPENSHLKFDALGPAADVEFIQNPSFYIAGTYTYVKLAASADPATVEAKFPALVEKYAAGQIEREIGVPYKKYVEDGNGYNYFLQPLADIHLHSQRTNEIKPGGNITAVRVLSYVAALIIIIAGINFVNLATARSAERAREVGVRKVLGSRRQQLIFQFLSESMLISCAAMIIAMLAVWGSLSMFNDVMGTSLQFDIVRNPVLIVVATGGALLLGVAAGLYPALYIAALKPVNVLKGKFRSSAGGKFLRNGLVVFQFCVSIVLISATLVVYDQLKFMQNKPLGFEKDGLLVINHNDNGQRAEALHQQIATLPGVERVGASSAVPGGYFFGLPFKRQGSEEIFTPKGMSADDDFVDVMNLKMVAGRAFSRDFDDSLSIMINQRAAKALGLTDPVGTILYNNANPETPVPYTIVGVMEDFNFESLHAEVAPLIFMSPEGQFNFTNHILVRINSASATSTLTAIGNTWNTMLPGEPFAYSFMDSRLDRLYTSEAQSGRLLMIFTMIAIAIACVGLFGLAAYTASQRTKEIGVRKVLGASVASIVGLLSVDFFKLVMLASLVAVPLAWMLLGTWLESFAYRVPLHFTTFAVACSAVVVFTAITVSYQAISASLINPAKSLKEE